METTVCPWCQTEIVWDEELGPEDECPYCHNELKGYRTLNIQLGSDEQDEQDEQEDEEGANWREGHQHGDETLFWGQEEIQHLPPSIRTLDKYEESHDLMNYEENVEKILDEQEEVPECPQCRDYMLLAGTQEVGKGFTPEVFGSIQAPVLEAPLHVNMYICTGCFHVVYNLSEEDRLRLVDHLSKEAD